MPGGESGIGSTPSEETFDPHSNAQTIAPTALTPSDASLPVLTPMGDDAAASAFKPQFAFPVVAMDRAGSVPKDGFSFHPAPLAFVPVAMAPPTAGAMGFAPVAAAGAEDYIFVDSTTGGVVTPNGAVPVTGAVGATTPGAPGAPPPFTPETTPEVVFPHNGGAMVPLGVTTTPALSADPPMTPVTPVAPMPVALNGAVAVAPHVLLTQRRNGEMIGMEKEEEELDLIESPSAEGFTPWCKPGKLYSMDVIG